MVVPSYKRLTQYDHGNEQALKRSLHQVNRKDVRVPDAPVFRPTVEEFGDPLKYITGIRHLVQKSGIAKIIPPEGEIKDPHTKGEERERGSCACTPPFVNTGKESPLNGPLTSSVFLLLLGNNRLEARVLCQSASPISDQAATRGPSAAGKTIW